MSFDYRIQFFFETIPQKHPLFCGSAFVSTQAGPSEATM